MLSTNTPQPHLIDKEVDKQQSSALGETQDATPLNVDGLHRLFEPQYGRYSPSDRQSIKLADFAVYCAAVSSPQAPAAGPELTLCADVRNCLRVSEPQAAFPVFAAFMHCMRSAINAQKEHGEVRW